MNDVADAELLVYLVASGVMYGKRVNYRRC